MTAKPAATWRRRLRREIAVALLVKLALLLLLWALFFSPTHRLEPDEAALSRRLAIGADT